MDWGFAIKKQNEALLRVVASLFAMMGVKHQRTSLPRDVRFAVLRILRPAESAARRLIFMFMTVHKVQADAFVPHARAASKRVLPAEKIVRKTRSDHVPAFKLYDTPKRFDHQRRKITQNPPRIRFAGFTPTIYEPPRSNQPIVEAKLPEGAQIIARVKALKIALGDLPKQAKRLARAEMVRAAAPAGPRKMPPMRPGYPPGYRKRICHEVDLILRDCHGLALQLRNAPP